MLTQSTIFVVTQNNWVYLEHERPYAVFEILLDDTGHERARKSASS